MSLYSKLRDLISSRKKINKYIGAFGIVRGISLFRCLYSSKNRSKIEILLPNQKNKIYLRSNTSDIGVFEEIFIDKIYNNLIGLEECKTIVDAGANIGLFARFILMEYPNAQVYCIEPEESNFELLQQNTIDYENVKLLKKGLWSSNAYLKFEDLNVSKWAFQVVESTIEKYDVEGISINDLMKTNQLSAIDVLKIDIEGSEKEVFEHDTSWLKKVNNLLVETHEDLREGSELAFNMAVSPYHFKQKKENTVYFLTK